MPTAEAKVHVLLIKTMLFQHFRSGNSSQFNLSRGRLGRIPPGNALGGVKLPPDKARQTPCWPRSSTDLEVTALLQIYPSYRSQQSTFSIFHWENVRVRWVRRGATADHRAPWSWARALKLAVQNYWKTIVFCMKNENPHFGTKTSFFIICQWSLLFSTISLQLLGES